MSYHNDPYRVDNLKIYPCLKERPDVLEVLKKSTLTLQNLKEFVVTKITLQLTNKPLKRQRMCT